MMTIKVHFDNGDHIITRFNGDAADVARYYLDKVFNLGTDGDELTTARAVEFLEGRPVQRFTGGRYCKLRRVYSLSPAYMARHDLYYKFRQTWDVYNGFSPRDVKDDYALELYD